MKISNSISKAVAFVIVFGTTISVALAQDARKITLDEAVNLSLQNSNHLKLSQTKIMEATAVLREAKERRLPDFTISGSYLRLNKPTVDLKVKLGGSSQGSGETGSGSGTGSSASSVEVNQAMYGLANLSLPLFAGFRVQHGIESAKYLEQASRLDAEKDRQEIIENTISAYSNLYKAKAALDIVKENLKQSQQRVADFSNLEKNGLMARNDLLKAQLQQSNVELALLDAENNWKITYINMNLILGLDENTELIPDSASFTSIADPGSFNGWESKALENRKDLKALGLRGKAANAGIKAAKGEYYPAIALTGGYIAADVPNVLTLTNAVNAGIGLKYTPSSLWKTGSKVEQAKARLQQVEVNESILTDAVRLQIAQAYQTLLSNNKKIDVYAKAVEQATENYRIVKNKYDNSLATTTDLLEADVAQLQAKLNYAYSKADAMVAYNRLLQTAGMLETSKK
jgi:outer membrane protein